MYIGRQYHLCNSLHSPRCNVCFSNTIAKYIYLKINKTVASICKNSGLAMRDYVLLCIVLLYVHEIKH